MSREFDIARRMNELIRKLVDGSATYFDHVELDALQRERVRLMAPPKRPMRRL